MKTRREVVSVNERSPTADEFSAAARKLMAVSKPELDVIENKWRIAKAKRKKR